MERVDSTVISIFLPVNYFRFIKDDRQKVRNLDNDLKIIVVFHKNEKKDMGKEKKHVTMDINERNKSSFDEISLMFMAPKSLLFTCL